MLTDTEKSMNSRVFPVDGICVEWEDGFWKERFDTCADNTIPQLQHMFENKNISHVVENFKICADEAQGDFEGTVFGDGDFYKWMEAAVYVAWKKGNTLLLNKLEEYVDLIKKVQQEDGYISTKQIIRERWDHKIKRMGDINDFEVYNFGHLFTSACLYKRITGKDSFLEVAVRAADYLEKLFGNVRETDYFQTAVCPSHYMGLIELYRTTGNEKYLNLAELIIELRDRVENGSDDNQDRISLKKHDKIIGHAVRANYLYAGVSDLCLERENMDYMEMLRKVWRNLVDKKFYITGGCGALYNGASPYGDFFSHQIVHQAYGYEYQLPSITAYNETCASIGCVYWAYRMFQMEPKAEYFDVIERIMLNTNLAAMSIDGKKYFYQNALRRTKSLDYKLIWPLTRSEYILSYCCPPNLARIIAQSSEYAYTLSEDSIWIGMYGANKVNVSLKNGAKFTLIQKTKYPYEGRVEFIFENVQSSKEFYLNLRIPSWSEKSSISVAGKQIHLSETEAGSYYSLKISDSNANIVILDLDMKVRHVVANNMVEEIYGQVAVERGPLVYCMESADTDVEYLDDIWIDSEAVYNETYLDLEGRKVLSLESEGYCINRKHYNRRALYQSLKYTGMKRKKIRFIPYFAWDNRGDGEMKVWFPIVFSKNFDVFDRRNVNEKNNHLCCTDQIG